MKIPYIQFVVGLADSPYIDYNNKKKKTKEVSTPQTTEEEIAALTSIL